MDYENLAKTWDKFGEQDPLWAILAWEGKAGNQWDPEEFFRVGQGDIAYMLAEAEKRKPITHRRRGLDFGCGVGRLTFPLSERFDEVHGVDISSPMIQKAQAFQEPKGRKNVTFHLNRRQDLSLFPDAHFDFIVTVIVLQHMEPKYFLIYLREFIRILAVDGVLLFQLPDATENRAHYEAMEENTEPVMEMYGMSPSEVVRVLESCGATVLDVHEDDACGKDLKSFRYYVTKTS